MSDKPTRRRANTGISDARTNDSKTQSQYQPYKDAAWGFINHWYPALFSDELPEDKVLGIQIAGVPLVLRRANGRVFALKDQCCHRGVRLSEQPMYYNKETISCWYHGFTFNLETGNLDTIIANPDDKLIGKTGITTYPVHEVNGMIFVFVREDDFPDDEVPPLAHDLPVRFPENNDRFPHPLWPDSPSVLDDGAVVRGIHRTGYGNWRIACENGIDNAHILVHKDNTIVHAMDWVLPLGLLPSGDDAIAIMEDENGPKGMMQWLYTDKWTPIMENQELGLKVEGTRGRYYRTSVVLPGVVMVENWPEDHVVQYEWFVPITDDTHEYWEVLVRICKTDAEREKFDHKFKTVYLPLCLHGFNDCDLYARESMQHFYRDGTGWDDEQLVATDVSPITWRKVASRHNRGIAKPGRGVSGSTRVNSQVLKGAAQGRAPGYYTPQIDNSNVFNDK